MRYVNIYSLANGTTVVVGSYASESAALTALTVDAPEEPVVHLGVAPYAKALSSLIDLES